jgi:uncharacterized protein (TIGR03437 family)
VDRDNSRPLSESNFYILIEPQVSGDGKIVAYTSTQECYFTQSTNCALLELLRTNVVGAHFPADSPGYGRVSPNGRYVATCCLSDASPHIRIYDLITGQVSDLVVPLLGDGLQAFADPGMLLAGYSNSVAIYRSNQSGWDSGTPIALSAPATQARLSRDGSTILYAAVISASLTGPFTYQLVSHDIASGKETMLDTFSLHSTPDASSLLSINNPGCCFSPWISDDGKSALYLAPAQSGGPLEVFAQNTDGSGRRLIANLPEGFNAITLSGNGRVAYAATPLGRLLRIEVETGATGQLSGPIPLINDLQPCNFTISCSLGSGAVSSGSVVWLLGTAFTENGEAPSVLVNGIKAPIFISSESYVRIQIPWETPVNQRISFVVETSTPQPFESVKTENSATIAPNMLLVSYSGSQSSANGFLELFHHDWSSLVNESHPAADGEKLHLYMTGLGPVSPAVSTGEPAPVREPLSRIVNPMTCQASPQQANIPVKFAGLAPGLTGVYQVDIQAPAGFSKANLLTCTITDSSGTVYSTSSSLP